MQICDDDWTKLIGEVIKQAHYDFVNSAPASPNYLSAKEFLSGQAKTRMFGYTLDNLCEILNVEPDFFRTKLIEKAAKERNTTSESIRKEIFEGIEINDNCTTW